MYSFFSVWRHYFVSRSRILNYYFSLDTFLGNTIFLTAIIHDLPLTNNSNLCFLVPNISSVVNAMQSPKKTGTVALIFLGFA